MEIKKLFLTGASALFLLPTCHAALEVTVAGGPDWLDANNTHVVISSVETDDILVNDIANSPQWKIGIGYPIFANRLEKNNFINQLLLELNLYHTRGTLKGDVWQFGIVEFNNYRFQAPFSSTRLMLDLKPILFTYQRFSPYVIAGIGVAYNAIKYDEAAIGVGVDPNSALSLGKNYQYQFSYEAGLGIRATLTPHLSASIEYLYAFLGNKNSPSDLADTVQMSEPPTFTVTSQRGLLGLTWTF